MTTSRSLVGSLADLPFPRLLHLLNFFRGNGVLHLADGELEKSVSFSDGEIVMATSSVASERLEATLVDTFCIGPDLIEEIGRGGSVDVGELVAAGHLTREQAARATEVHVRGILMGLFEWVSGGYRFAEGPVPGDTRLAHAINVNRLIISGIRLMEAPDGLPPRFTNPRELLEICPEGSVAMDDFMLEREEWFILSQLDGATTISDLCLLSPKPPLETQKLLYALEILGVIRFRLPRAKSADDLEAGQRGAYIKKKKILIAEDDSIVRASIVDYLSGRGYELLQAADGTATLQQVRRELPDLLILDNVLPGRDGFTITEQIRRSPATKNLPIIMLTSLGSEKQVLKGLEMGSSAYMIKPFRMQELLGNVVRLLGEI